MLGGSGSYPHTEGPQSCGALSRPSREVSSLGGPAPQGTRRRKRCSYRVTAHRTGCDNVAGTEGTECNSHGRQKAEPSWGGKRKDWRRMQGHQKPGIVSPASPVIHSFIYSLTHPPLPTTHRPWPGDGRPMDKVSSFLMLA